jgi:uncharacterized membrane protein YcfT
MFKSIIGALVKPFVEVGTTMATGWDARKTAKQKGAQKLEDARQELKVVKVQASIAREQVAVQNDSDYDMQVLKNREKTYADELLIALWMSIFIMHFIPKTQPHMAAGWAAMGYTDGPAWWFELGMVGILVSTLGLMKILKLMLSGGFGKK